MATAFGSLRPDLVEFVIGTVDFSFFLNLSRRQKYPIKAQAGSTQLPVASELTYKGQRWQKMDEYMQIDDLAELGKYFNLPEEFGQAFSPKYGTFVVLRGPGGFLWKGK